MINYKMKFKIMNSQIFLKIMKFSYKIIPISIIRILKILKIIKVQFWIYSNKVKYNSLIVVMLKMKLMKKIIFKIKI